MRDYEGQLSGENQGNAGQSWGQQTSSLNHSFSFEDHYRVIKVQINPKNKLFSVEPSPLRLTAVEDVINDQAAQGYRVHSFHTEHGCTLAVILFEKVQ
ncbi:Uncharacterised protein [Scardovia inopinata]|uniref:DUF4177 domain-containing protein n=1 Tax=Scardovia inopinata F0304 TaxID=641146 RepID=W1MXA1_SCAIO|nr:hypothetical protein [Scardovia inopinata]EQW15228.1 hypothetical protein HMPREF9020_01542 [Scardovia inopinata F0304]BAR07342.1 hypothetical protein SCIP_1275 [Scardovia inopinata JCM 12537]SUV51418.1 Uncharacterised protein [Scardovia inopinata]